jgi:hypothetical protein
VDEAAILASDVEDECAGSWMSLASLHKGIVDTQMLQILEDEVAKKVIPNFSENAGGPAKAPQIGRIVGRTSPHSQQILVDERQLTCRRERLEGAREYIRDQYSQTNNFRHLNSTCFDLSLLLPAAQTLLILEQVRLARWIAGFAA